MALGINYCPFCGSKRLEDFISTSTIRGNHCKKCGGNFEVEDHIAADICYQCGEDITGKRSFTSVKMANGKVKHNRCRKARA